MKWWEDVDWLIVMMLLILILALGVLLIVDCSAATLLTYFDPPELTLTLEPEAPKPVDPDALIAEHAYRFLGVQRVPLPVPYKIVWLTVQKEGAGSYLDPENGRRSRAFSRGAREASPAPIALYRRRPGTVLSPAPRAPGQGLPHASVAGHRRQGRSLVSVGAGCGCGHPGAGDYLSWGDDQTGGSC
jgi:hypothetical protein